MQNKNAKLNILVIATVIFGVFGAFSAAHAMPVYAASFNNDSQDRATLRATDFTINSTCNTCWTTNLGSVRPGDIVSFAIYYHNTGSDTAHNTTVRISVPGGPSTSFNASGSVDADNSSAAYGSATVSLSSSQSQTLTYIPGSVRWYADQCTSNSCARALPFGQNGSEILGAGLNIGDIATGWPAQGSVVVQFQVSNSQPVQNPTVTISANPTSVSYGGTSNLTWSSSNATSCTASGDWSGSKSLSGSEGTGQLFSGKNYTITCTNSAGQSVSASASVSVQSQQQAPTVTISASPNPVNYGSSSNLSWSSSNANSCYASGGWSGTKNLSGSENTGTLYNSQTFTITCSNSAGQSVSASVTVNVNQQQQQAPTVNIYASPSTVDYGNSSILYWSSTNANSCYASGGWSGTKSTSGSENSGSLYNSQTYTITCSNNAGSNSSSVTVFTNQQQQQLPVITTQCYATSIGDTTATLNATVSPNNSNSGTTVWFEYGRNSVTDLQSSSQVIYGNTTVSRSVSNLSPNSTYFCRAVAQNNAGRVNGQINSFTTSGAVVQAPFVTTNPATSIGNSSATLNGFVTTNSISNTTTWFEYGTTLNLGAQTPAISEGSVSATSFSRFVSSLAPGTAYYFRAVAQNAGGVGRGSILSFVTGQVLGQVGTNRASITKEVANLSFPNGTKTAIAGWAGNTIEYAITVRNTGDTTLNNLNITDALSPFVAFKSASDNGSNNAGTVSWNNLTLSPGESKRVTVQVTAGKFDDNVVAENVARVSNSAVARTSNNTIAIINLYPLTLSIVPDKDTLNSGDDVTYTINYKNEGKSNLTEAVLRVILPTGEDYVSSNGTFTQENNTATFQIGNIAQEGAGTITVRAKVKDNVTKGDKLTAVAVMDFKDTFSNQQLSVKAYAQNTVGEVGTVLGTSASIFGSGFFPSSLVGWLLLVLLLVLLVLFIRRMFDYRRPATTTSTPSMTTTPSNP